MVRTFVHSGIVTWRAKKCDSGEPFLHDLLEQCVVGASYQGSAGVAGGGLSIPVACIFCVFNCIRFSLLQGAVTVVTIYPHESGVRVNVFVICAPNCHNVF